MCPVESFVSSEHLNKCGVPQGSILGPLLFLLYINDLPECLKNTRSRLFADDTILTPYSHSIADIEIAVNSELENLRNWLMAMNVAKNEFMLIGSPQMIRNASNSQSNILIENKQIQQVNKSRTVGTTIDQHLSWKPNTENICKKITSGISALHRVKPFIAERDTLISIYHAIVRPYFDYCSEVWDVLYFGKYNLIDHKRSISELLKLFKI